MPEHDSIDFDTDDSSASSERKASKRSSTSKGTERKVSGWKFAAGVILGVAIFVGILVAIGARPEHQDLTPPEASEQETTRQALAEQAVRIERSAQQLQEDEENASLQSVAEAASIYAEDLGGVWVPWPDGAPTGYTNPPLETEPPVDLTGTALVEELVSFSESARSAIDSAPAAQRQELASMALGAQLLAMDLAESGEAEVPSCGEVDIAAAGAAANSTSTLEVADAARQWLETDASNLPAGARDPELIRINAVSTFEEAILRSGTADTRSAFAAYPELAEGETYTSQALHMLSAELLTSAAEAEPAERDALLSFGCSLFLTSSERAAALPLPGVEG
ncbi:hypothetical protein VR010_08775 [Actinomycetaceae bacterium L2_0104]